MVQRRRKQASAKTNTAISTTPTPDKDKNFPSKLSKDESCQNLNSSSPGERSNGVSLPLADVQNKIDLAGKGSRTRRRNDASKGVEEGLKNVDKCAALKRSTRLRTKNAAPSHVLSSKENKEEDKNSSVEIIINPGGRKQKRQAKRRFESSEADQSGRIKRSHSGQMDSVSESSTKTCPDVKPNEKTLDEEFESHELLESQVTLDNDNDGVLLQKGLSLRTTSANFSTDENVVLDDLNTKGESLRMPVNENGQSTQDQSILLNMVLKEFSKLHAKHKKLKESKLEHIESQFKEQERRFLDYVHAAEALLHHLKESNGQLRSKLNDFNKLGALDRLAALECKNAEIQDDLLQERAENLSLKEELKKLTSLLAAQCYQSENAESGSHTGTIHSEDQLCRSNLRDYAVQTEAVHIQTEKSYEDTKQGENLADISSKIVLAMTNNLFQTLLQHMVGLKFTVLQEANQLQFLIRHESSGYSFKLRYIPPEKSCGNEEIGELFYCCVSLGTLERIAPEWMKKDIVFKIVQVNLFFNRILKVANGRLNSSLAG